MQFEPDPHRARELDQLIHDDLAASLRHVVEAGRDHLTIDDAAFERFCRSVQVGARYAPAVFARYYDLVFSLGRDDLTTAQRLLDEIVAATPVGGDLDVIVLRPPAADELSARYLRMLRDGGEAGLGIAPPNAKTAERFAERLVQGFALLDEALPDLAGEIRGLIRQIVILGSDPGARQQIDGGSHYQLWGALFLNADFHSTPLAVAEVLAHESGHSLLFGLCRETALVENDPEERFSSPLRTDERPMDGVFHATFVSARMHWTMSRLARSPALTSDQQAEALACARVDADNFAAGIDIVRRHARLTPLGAAILDVSTAYMSVAA